jgi:predicted PurR-regulated permease PerM
MAATDPLTPPGRPTNPGDLSHLVVPLRIIAGLMIVGAVYLTWSILVPFLVAIVLAIALQPVVERLHRLGLPNSLASLAGMLIVAGVLLGVGALVTYQAGSILQDSQHYMEGFGRVATRLAKATGSERLMDALESARTGNGEAASSAQDQPSAPGDESAKTQQAKDSPASNRWEGLLRRNAERIASYLMTGLGGLLGLVGNLVLMLAFLFYMLLSRQEWMDRLTLAMSHLGLRPGRRELETIQTQMVRYLGRLGLVSLSYVAFVSVGLWLIGIPQPLLWGVLTGVLEVVPYIGPVMATTLPAIVSLGSGTLSQPAMVIGLFLILQAIEGYVVTPLLYGDAVSINPVTVLFGVLFFGWLLGPGGLLLAMPLMILLRGLLVLAPDTPALDAVFEADKQVEAIEESAKEEAKAHAT